MSSSGERGKAQGSSGGAIDEVALFQAALTEDDITEIVENGLARTLGLAPVDPVGKLTTTWATIKQSD
jgi:hypothetical protein